MAPESSESGKFSSFEVREDFAGLNAVREDLVRGIPSSSCSTSLCVELSFASNLGILILNA